MFSLTTPPFFARLEKSSSVLIAGAGGGFDVYAGLPLALALADAGKQVHLGNVSFAGLGALPPDAWLAPDLARITAETQEGAYSYFPERTLARWLARQDRDWPVYAFPQTGVQPLRAAYRELVERCSADAIVLVDGGTDIWLRGDEAGLGTPEEDMASLAAVAALDDVPVRLVASLGFGIDAFHGVNHVQVLENLAALEADGAYLGAFSLPPASAEGRLPGRRLGRRRGDADPAVDRARADRRRDARSVRGHRAVGTDARQQVVALRTIVRGEVDGDSTQTATEVRRVRKPRPPANRP